MREHDHSIDRLKQLETTIDAEATVDLVKGAERPEQDLGSIGRYRLLSKLGEGGMGQVWLAEQTEPVQRQVALKLIRAGRYDTSALQRFDLERRSLAIMEHPAIAKVFDADSTAEGQPYFVMEYVAGLPITKYCDQKRMTTRERLALFIRVCQGVQHAHQKAIIHRDLKPSNVLVVEVDGKPQPRIIDFGIAKPASQPQGETMVTGLGGMVGTPGYMSPEQADPSTQDVDTRTDVYSLGVILYELLSGALPFDPKKWRNRPFDEVLRALREDDPPSPSTKISSDGRLSLTAAERRKTEPRQLVSVLRGDLDWITLKALERDRARRYATPLELAADLEHCLNNEPVSARPASRGSRLKKYAQRNRVAVAAGAALVVLLAAFGVTELLQVRRITRERDRANRIADFMAGMFKVSDPSEARGNAVTAREILDKASKEIQSGLAKDPEVQAQMQYTMARTYSNLGLFVRAHQLAEAALATRRRMLGETSSATLESMTQLGWIQDREGKDAEAEKTTRQALADAQRIFGPEHGLSLEAMDNLSVILEKQGHYDDEEKLQRELVEIRTRQLGTENPSTIRSMANLAAALHFQGRFAESEPMYRKALELERRVLGPEHPQTLATMHNLANAMQEAGRYHDAEKLYRETMAIEERVLGAEHPDTANTLTNLANTVVYAPGRNQDAEAMYRKALAIEERFAGHDHPYTIYAMEGLANVLSTEGRYQDAEKMHREILATRLRTLPPEHSDVLLSKYNLAEVLGHEGRLSDAEKMFRETLEAQRRVLGQENPDTLATDAALARVLMQQGRYREAEGISRQTWETQSRTLGQQHMDSLNTLLTLAKTLVSSGRYTEAKSLFQQTIDNIDRAHGVTLSTAWYDYACVATVAKDREAALQHLQEAIALGYDATSLKDDEGMMWLRGDARFEALVRAAEASPDTKAGKLD